MKESSITLPYEYATDLVYNNLALSFSKEETFEKAHELVAIAESCISCSHKSSHCGF